MPAKKKTTKKVKTTSTSTKKVTRKPRAVKSAPAKVASFKLAKETTPFTSTKITEQTVYWTILLAYIFFISIWILKIHLDTMDILEKVNML